MQNDSISKTLGVAVGICVVCSVFVSSAAVLLKERQKANQLRDRMENILNAAGLGEEELYIDNEALRALFEEKIDVRVVDLDSGELLTDVDPDSIDERAALKDAALSEDVPAEEDIAQLKRRAKRQRIYLLREGNELVRIILPVHGKGLWSTLYGFVAVSPDAQTIENLSFYEHGETPGLGGEIDNPSWRASWVGKKPFDADGNSKITVLKGPVAADDPDAQHHVDGISGATITARGVQNLIRYWLGEDGYGPALAKLREQEKRP
jgi:Na+-transporting NADH:ubiquinone oxidoreductase subunit C